MLRSVKAHVLKKVSQTALVVFLLNRTDFLRYVEVGLMLWIGIVSDVISKTVVEFADSHAFVDR